MDSCLVLVTYCNFKKIVTGEKIKIIKNIKYALNSGAKIVTEYCDESFHENR